MIDKLGRLQITGRLKDIIITAGGENISPHPIENALKMSCPILSYCVLIGEKRQYLTMLVTLKVRYDGSGRATDELDPNVQSFLFRKYNPTEPIKTLEQARNSSEVVALIQAAVDEVNSQA